jgi:hypothetical protein
MTSHHKPVEMASLSRRCGKGVWELLIYAADHGWQISLTRGGHLRLTKPGRGPVFTSSTPSDHRAYLNALAMLRRADRSAPLQLTADDEAKLARAEARWQGAMREPLSAWERVDLEFEGRDQAPMCL